MSSAPPLNGVPEEAPEPGEEAGEVLQRNQVSMRGGERVIEDADGDDPGSQGPESNGQRRERPPARITSDEHEDKRQGVGEQLPDVAEGARAPGATSPAKAMA